MVISKFNKMIRNRWLWGIFAVIVSASFVFMFTADGGCGPAHDADPVIGRVAELTVTRNELQRARFFTELQVTLMTGRPLADRSPELMQELENMAWRRALALKKAEAFGLHATDGEVVMHIQQNPMFSADGVFERRLYDQFVNAFLARIGVGRRHYDDFVREEVVIEKLMQTVSASVWIAPRELEQHLQTYTDVFTVQSVELSTHRVETVDGPERPELETYYEENIDDFALPERRVVDYVEFTAEAFKDRVTITDDEVADYYADHLFEFRRDGAAAHAPDMDLDTFDEMATDIEERWEYLYLDEVADDIRTRLTEREALHEAMDAATDFVMELVPPRRGETPVSFAAAAEAAGVLVHRTEPFSRMDPPEELEDADAMFVTRTAFDLADTPEEYFSNAIAGESVAYVLALRDVIPPGIPPLEEIVDWVREEWMRERMATRLAEHADSVRRSILEAMEEEPELSFDEAVAAKGLEARRYGPFSVFDVPDELAYEGALNAVTSLNANELSETVSIDEQTRMLLYVSAREPMDEMSRNMLRRQIRDNLYHYRSQQVFAEWQSDLLDRLEIVEPDIPAGAEDSPARRPGRRPLL